jgi:tetrahydromethanopterin S-methyltransferase subunit C
MNLLKGLGVMAIGVTLGVSGVFVGEYDDAPGASLIGILLMIGAVAVGVRIARRKAED